MYIEFDILTATDDFDQLEKRVREWARHHDIPYTTKVAKGLKYRLGLNTAQDFAVFFLTWQGPYQIKNATDLDLARTMSYK